MAHRLTKHELNVFFIELIAKLPFSPITDPLLLTLDFRSLAVCFMPTSSWSACACPSSDPRQTSRSLNGQWFWPCLIQYYQVFPVFCTPCMGFYEAASSAV